MGMGTYNPADWAAYTARTSTKATSAIYTSRSLAEDLDPAKFAFRESRDSAANPATTPILAALDVTGSMGELAGVLARKGLGTLYERILDKKPVGSPQLAVAAYGDVRCDRVPLQVTQFESEVAPLVPQLERIYLEGGGGGNDSESQNLAWYFAATKTRTDAFEKRGKRGYLFTFGDEMPPEDLRPEDIRRVFGGEPPAKAISNADLLRMVGQTWDVFHVIIEEGHYARGRADAVRRGWTALLGQQRVIPLADHTLLAEAVVAAIEAAEGRTLDDVTNGYSASNALVISRAVRDVAGPAKGGMVRF
jgi:hypothetical protein